MYRRYGTTDLSLQQSQDLATRYDGFTGVLNYGSDLFQNTFFGW
jgi:hypothetical protein